jgi:predicted transcriptional regulator
MANVDKVFSIIKREIENQKRFGELSNFRSIAMSANVPFELLPMYLSLLQSKGMIKYSVEHKYIQLTSEGRKYKIMPGATFALA